MRTVVLGPPPVELEALIARRRSLGLDMFDEVWKGEYHMAPAPHRSHGWLGHQLAVLIDPLAVQAGLYGSGPFNLGTPDDFRVPDHGFLRDPPTGAWAATAAIVVEVESPDDETWDKLDFYAEHGVDEILIVSAESRSVTWSKFDGDSYMRTEYSHLLGPTTHSLIEKIKWPPAPSSREASSE